MKRIIGLFLLIISIFSLVSCGNSANGNEVGETETAEARFLHTEGSTILNGDDEQITLEGTNLGGWLVQEYWMCPVRGDPSVEKWTQTQTIDVLTERFGAEAAQELILQYEQHWITEDDISDIAASGCNCIRVPFGCWSFMTESEDGTWSWLSDDQDEIVGFQMLDWVIAAAEKNGLYVILDMHGCPGGQSYDHTTGMFSYRLFSEESCQQAMQDIWTAIAARYADNPVVAGYDIMNEAVAKDYTGDVENDPRNLLYNRIYEAIRTVDPNHMIIFEGTWSYDQLPDPEDTEWENFVYSIHVYNATSYEEKIQEIADYGEAHSIPMYIGEFAESSLYDLCREAGLSFTSWTYKGTVSGMDNWFMYYSSSVQAVDVMRDSYDIIMEKWGDPLLTTGFTASNDTLSHWAK